MQGFERESKQGVLYGEMILFKYLPFVTPPDCCTLCCLVLQSGAGTLPVSNGAIKVQVIM